MIAASSTGPVFRRLVDGMLDRLGDQPLHALAMLFLHLLALLLDQGLEELGMLGDASCEEASRFFSVASVASGAIFLSALAIWSLADHRSFISSA